MNAIDAVKVAEFGREIGIFSTDFDRSVLEGAIEQKSIINKAPGFEFLHIYKRLYHKYGYVIQVIVRDKHQSASHISIRPENLPKETLIRAMGHIDHGEPPTVRTFFLRRTPDLVDYVFHAMKNYAPHLQFEKIDPTYDESSSLIEVSDLLEIFYEQHEAHVPIVNSHIFLVVGDIVTDYFQTISPYVTECKIAGIYGDVFAIRHFVQVHLSRLFVSIAEEFGYNVIQCKLTDDTVKIASEAIKEWKKK